jgi:hypothetical protein
MTASSTGQALLTMIESDLLTAAGTPLLTLIEALKAGGTNPFAAVAAWGQFIGNLQPALITFETALATQILTAVQTKITEAIASAQAVAAAPK